MFNINKDTSRQISLILNSYVARNQLQSPIYACVLSQPQWLGYQNATFCNVNVSYIHQEQNDLVSVETWLPIDYWNGRLQAAGGSGLRPGRFEEIRLELSLNDLSYFNSCSQGGRRGFELAQKHPTAFDCIAASAPAIHWAHWAPAMFWPQILMNIMGEYPRGCELDFLTSLAIQECDGLDGVVDGIILNPKACIFDPFKYIDASFTCLSEDVSMELSQAAAVIAKATWSGPSDSAGNFICVCKGDTIPLAYQWIQLFVEKDPDYDYTTITREDYDEIMRRSGAECDPIVASNQPNLTSFHEAGGKMMTYHGLVHFYRFYEVPGLPHCFSNGQPTTVFDALRACVENGTMPSFLPTILADAHGVSNERILCPYPKSAYTSLTQPDTYDPWNE
ncbi:hypothetical protein M426DRAFT_70927 [Hypoxylon sp. CI-4A]|nr:hypothetical protein M426DRAFT_70927 [Hypoxylon sp. CI-4A]